MKAMVMPIAVREPKALEGLKPSMFVDFTLVVEKNRSYAENVRVHAYENLAQEPLLVRRLELLARLDSANPAPAPLAIGAAGAGFHAHRSDRAAGESFTLRGQGGGSHVHLHQLSPPRLLFPAVQQFRARPEALRRHGWAAIWCC